MSRQTIPAEQIALRIRLFRGEKGLLDFALFVIALLLKAAGAVIRGLGLFISFPVSLLAIAGSYRSFQPATA